jgi:UDP-glucose 4-epimerase
MRYLITGGAGFIGSHLADALISRGDWVTIVDDLSTGSFRNIKQLKGHPQFSYVLENMDDRSLLAELVDDADIVFHLAAAVGVRLIVESPVRTIETNVHCTELLLEAAAKKRRPVFIASTSEVYGKSAAVPFREDGDLVMGATTRGRWSYACSKALDEFLAIAYQREKGLPVVIGRFFNTVGPRQTGTYGMVVPTFVRDALAGRPVVVFGDGAQSRCFTHVSDAVRAAIDLMDSPKTVGGVYNIGSTEEVTILSLAKRVIAMTGSSSMIEFRSYEEAYGEGFEDMSRRVPCLERIRATIGYEPRYRLDDVLRSVMAYQASFERDLEIPSA